MKRILRVSKNRAGRPPPEVKVALKELTLLLVDHLPNLDEKVLQVSIKKTFTTVEKGYGSIIALRNTMKNAISS